MEHTFRYRFLLLASIMLFIFSCKSKTAGPAADEPPDVRVPVTTTSVTYDPMEEFVMLNATSTYQQKSIIKANATGYVTSSSIKLYSYVTSGQVLFTVKTKEATSLGNTINKLDPSFHFSGVNSIHSNKQGYVTELDHQIGDYVQDNEQLAIISDKSSFVFLLDLPYEYKAYVSNNKSVEITLPDGEKMKGIVTAGLPIMDSLSQTQAVVIKVNASNSIPQNLVAKVKIIKSAKAATTALPKAAVLSDETQSTFWVMKMINDSTAVKIPVKKGIETLDKVEILSPNFNPSDKILLTGNYGLGDTARVVMAGAKKEEPDPKDK